MGLCPPEGAVATGWAPPTGGSSWTGFAGCFPSLLCHGVQGKEASPPLPPATRAPSRTRRNTPGCLSPSPRPEPAFSLRPGSSHARTLLWSSQGRWTECMFLASSSVSPEPKLTAAFPTLLGQGVHAEGGKLTARKISCLSFLSLYFVCIGLKTANVIMELLFMKITGRSCISKCPWTQAEPEPSHTCVLTLGHAADSTPPLEH